jgi:hypothetical protein
MQQAKRWILYNKAYFAGMVLGGLSGYFYWKYVGCLTGTCAITSKPFNSVVYFALLGALLLGSLQKPKKGISRKGQL